MTIPTQDQQDDIMDEAQDAMNATFATWIDARHARTGEPRPLLTLLVGKAMFLSASVFVGNALQLSAAESLREAAGVLKRFQHLARRKHGRRK